MTSFNKHLLTTAYLPAAWGGFMNGISQQRRWVWLTLLLSSISIVALVFAFWELVENRYFRDLDYVSLHYLYISRGIASSLLLAAWAAWFVLRLRRSVEEQLRRSEERYRGLLNASPSAVALLDANLQVHEWNVAAARLYGVPREEAVDAPLTTVPFTREDELHGFMRDVAAGHAVLEHETQRVNRAGERIEVQLSLLPFREQSELYFMEVTSDIRDQVRLRQRLIELEKLTSMGQMAAGTAHHLNTPLASMLLRMELMRDRVTDPESVRSDLDRLEQTLRFCQTFVRRLLDFSRRPTLQREPEQIGRIIDAVLGFLSPSFNAKQLRVTCNTGDVSSEYVLADRNQLETLLLILLTNSMDATDVHGNINISVERDGTSALALSVADNGCGIADPDRAHIFEPFFTTKPPGKGTGLGLAIARNIAREHGGDIHIESRLGEGTRVTVLLPTTTAAHAEA